MGARTARATTDIGDARQDADTAARPAASGSESAVAADSETAAVIDGTSVDSARRPCARGRLSFRRARALAFGAVVALVALGLALPLGTGVPSSFGIDQIAAICPLGALEVMVGSHRIMLHPLVLLLVMVAVIALVGKAFCSWMCPAPWLERLLRPKKSPDLARRAAKVAREDAADAAGAAAQAAPHAAACAHGATASAASTLPHGAACAHGDSSCRSCALAPVGGARDGLRFDTRHATLLGALGATAVFGFPVFCLVCPIGVTFATFIGLWHLFQFNETSWGLIVFPAILVLEVVFLRKWCAKICPISALVSLISGMNRTLRPRVRRDACLREAGIDCHVCVDACPEQVDPHSNRIPECSKCGICVEACPANAIDIKLLSRKSSASPNAMQEKG